MVGIYNLEPKYKNLALEKIKKYYIDMGELVEDYFELNYNKYEKIYCSSIFDFTPKKYVRPNMICGGSGFDLTTELPKEIEQVKPRLNFGFTTRGCFRKCPFCIVPQKEGRLKIVGDIYDIWDTKSKDIILMDNNILGLPEHFRVICSQIKKEKLRVDFNQGLDIRLLNDENVKLLSEIRHKEYHLAFDNVEDENKIIKGIELLKKYGIKRSIFYLLVGYNTTYKQDIYRAELLKSLNQNGYIQRYNHCSDKFYIELTGWVNNHRFFQSITFETFLKYRGSWELFAKWQLY